MALEWQSPAIILDSIPYGETSLIVHVLTKEHGLWSGLAKGGASRRQNVKWQKGAICLLSWKARLEGQLGFFSSEIIKNPAMILLDNPLSLLMLSNACALCHKSLPQKEKNEAVFNALLRFLSLLMIMPQEHPFADYFRWEASLLTDLGYGLNLSSCAVTGLKDLSSLSYVSPRTGHAVSLEGAGQWRDRLLELPSFLLFSHENGTASSWWKAQKLLGHFWAKFVFAALHSQVPQARGYLIERLLQTYKGEIMEDYDIKHDQDYKKDYK